MLDKNFKDIISNIKEEIINTQIKTMQEVNSNLIMLYFIYLYIFLHFIQIMISVINIKLISVFLF